MCSKASRKPITNVYIATENSRDKTEFFIEYRISIFSIFFFLDEESILMVKLFVCHIIWFKR